MRKARARDRENEDTQANANAGPRTAGRRELLRHIMGESWWSRLI